MRFFSSFTIGLFSCLLLVGCQKEICNDPTDPDCPNYDYCATVDDLSADFDVFLYWEHNPGFSDGKLYPMELTIEDTTRGGPFHFRAEDTSADDYEWNFPRDPRTFYGRLMEASFWPDVISGEVELKLTTLRTEEKCPERGTEIASKSRTVYVIPPEPAFPLHPVLGRFTGNNESEPDSADFVITFFEDTEGDAIRVKGFPRNAVNDEVLNNAFVISNYKQFYIEPTANICCDRVHGYGQLSDDKQHLRIEYKTYDFDHKEWIDWVWTGERLN